MSEYSDFKIGPNSRLYSYPIAEGSQDVLYETSYSKEVEKKIDSFAKGNSFWDEVGEQTEGVEFEEREVLNLLSHYYYHLHSVEGTVWAFDRLLNGSFEDKDKNQTILARNKDFFVSSICNIEIMAGGKSSAQEVIETIQLKGFYTSEIEVMVNDYFR